MIIVWIDVDWESDCARRMSLVFVKPIQIRLGLWTDHCSSYLQSVLHPVQGAFVQDVDAAPTVDQNSGDPTAANVHGDDQGVMRKCMT